MKAKRFFTMTLLVLASLITVITGCKYDVAEPKWDKPAGGSVIPVITQIIPPDSAVAGVSTITIQGQNFADASSVNLVYFGNVPAIIASSSTTAITVYRPNLSVDTCTISVVSYEALYPVKKGPYKVNRVISSFGSFVANDQLNTVALDNAENLYVIKGTTPFTVYKITPDGVRTTVATATQSTGGPTVAKIGPDGNLYYMGTTYVSPGSIGAQKVGMINMQTGTDSLWYKSTKFLTCFDFDVNGYLYAGGVRTTLQVIRPNKSARLETVFNNTTDTIWAIRVFGTNLQNQNLYVAAGTPTGHAIWVSSLADTSKVGDKTLFYDLSTTTYANSPIRSISFSADGSKLYIGFYSPDPILVVDVATQHSETLYKGIIPDYCRDFCIGTKLYLISGNANVSPAINWYVYKVDIGINGAPYY